MKYTFKLTCGACPEQYDVFDDNGNQVAYVRLRYGHLRVDVPDVGGETIYEYSFDDGLQGCFDSEEQRQKYLKKIDKAIAEHYN